MALRAGERGARIVAQINITPLIDVMLVLLILFMVVTPVTTRSLDTALPNPTPSSSPPQPRPAFLVLEVSESGLALNRAAVASPGDLESRLRDVLVTRADKTLFVSVSGAVSYGTVVEALDAARAAGATRIGLLGSLPGAD